MPLYTPYSDPYARYGWTAPDRGYLAENIPASLCPGSAAPSTAGRLEFAKVRLPVAGPVTNIVMFVNSAGSTLTSGQNFAALFTGAGALLAQTADQTTAWGSTGLKTMAIAGGAQTLAVGNYFVGFWYNGTTSPAWIRGTGGGVYINNGTATPNLLWGSADTGLTTTAPANMGAQTSQGSSWWVALS